MEKCERIMREPWGKKTYMTENLMSKVRQIFLTRVKLQPFAGNFKADKRFAKTKWLCRCGWETEQESHLVSGECPVYGDLVTLLEDKGDDKDLLTFFTAVLERRGELEEEERSREPVVAGGATDIASPATGQASA